MLVCRLNNCRVDMDFNATILIWRCNACRVGMDFNAYHIGLTIYRLSCWYGNIMFIMLVGRFNACHVGMDT